MDGLRLYTSIIAQLLVVYHCRAARVIIDDFSPRITYNTRVLSESSCKFNPGNTDCDGTWWFEHGDSRGADLNDTVHTTRGPGTKLTLEFQGPSVAMYGIALVQIGAQAIVTIDRNTPVRVDFNISDLPGGARLVTQQLLFSTFTLDPSVSHTITVAYDNSRFQSGNPAWMGVDYFEVDEPSQQSSIAEGATQSALPSQPSISSSSAPPELSSISASTASPEPRRPSASSSVAVTKSSANIGGIVGGVIGTAAGILLAGLVLVLTRRWLRQRRLSHRLLERR